MRNESLVIFQDVIKSLGNRKDIDFIIWGGNLTENNDRQLSDLPSFLDASSELNHPYYVILGNNESKLTAAYTKQYFCAEFRRNGFLDTEKTYWSAEPSGNVLLIGLDTTIDNKDNGDLPKEELLWLDDLLKSNPNKFTIISMHHPAFIENPPPNPAFKNAHLIDNAQEFMTLINNYPQVKLIVSGDDLNYSVSKLNNKIYMNLPSINTYPCEYKVISVSPEKISIENNNIAFKQIIKKAKKSFLTSAFAAQYGFTKNKDILNYQNSNEYNKIKEIYFN